MNYHMFHDSFTGDIEHSGIFDLFPKIYEKTSQEILAEVKVVVKTGALKVLRPRPVLPESAMTGVCQQPTLTYTAITTKRKGEEERN